MQRPVPPVGREAGLAGVLAAHATDLAYAATIEQEAARIRTQVD